MSAKSPLHKEGMKDLGMAAWSLWGNFSQPAPGLNQNLSWPFENERWSSEPRPFVAWGSEDDPYYWGFDPHWRSAAVLGGVYAVVRAMDPEQGNSHLGYAFEHLVRADLTQRGVELHHGKVELKKGSGLECDVLLESPDFLIFVELKRKSLTHRARQGDSLTLLLDLVNSFLYAQTQAIRLEAELRARGKLHFQGSKSDLIFQGQRCLRVSLTLDSYGRLHDVHLIQKLFQAAYVGDFSIPSNMRTPERDAQLKSIKTVQLEFRKYANQLSALPGYVTARDPLGVLRHDAAFLGLAEWWTLLEHLPDQARGNDFVDALANKLLELALERSPSSDLYRRLLGETQGYPTFVRAPS